MAEAPKPSSVADGNVDGFEDGVGGLGGDGDCVLDGFGDVEGFVEELEAFKEAGGVGGAEGVGVDADEVLGGGAEV